MSFRKTILAGAAVAGLTFAGGLAAAGPAHASSTGCAFTNGCATLHGTDAAGDTVAMDAKYQHATEILIGYPDNSGDNATSFDGVLHYGKGTKTTSYTDTGFTLSPTFTSVPCITGTPAPQTPLPTSGALVVTGHTLTVEATSGDVTAAPSSGALITANGGAAGGTLTVTEAYAGDGTSCVAAYNYNVAPGATPALTLTSTDFAKPTFPTSPGGSTWTFLDSDTSGAFSFTGLPAGVSHSGGSLTADTSTAIPGTYTNVGVTFTATDGAVYTATFTLKVSGIKSTTPGAGVPYYTFVYSPHGDWTNQCVTDLNGSGALRLVACTGGRNTGQDFTTDAASGLLGSAQAHYSNLLAAAVSKPSSCLTDPSTADPVAGQSDASDERVPGGRQMYVNGSCAAGANLWSWGT